MKQTKMLDIDNLEFELTTDCYLKIFDETGDEKLKIELTKKQSQILTLLMKKPDGAVSRRNLLMEIYGFPENIVFKKRSSSMDVQIKYLRTKFRFHGLPPTKLIRTVYNVGYMWTGKIKTTKEHGNEK